MREHSGGGDPHYLAFDFWVSLACAGECADNLSVVSCCALVKVLSGSIHEAGLKPTLNLVGF